MASIQDVAKRAGVSVATVSRVLNDKKNISAKTKEKVLSAITELDYQPNELARSLFHQRTFIIGVIIPDIGHPYYSKLTCEIELALYDLGYKIMLCSTDLVPSREKEYIDMLRRHKVDGIIICTHSLDVARNLDEQEYLKLSMPLISINRIIGSSVVTVYSDHRKGGILAAEKLLQNGCRHILQISGRRLVASHSDDRHDAFSQLVGQSSASLIDYRLERDTFSFDDYLRHAHGLLETYPQVDGVFATDLIAAAFVHEAHILGRRIPQDMRIIGIDGTIIAKVVYPPLTCVRQDMKRLAAESVRALMSQIHKEEPPAHDILVDMQLCEGGTTL